MAVNPKLQAFLDANEPDAQPAPPATEPQTPPTPVAEPTPPPEDKPAPAPSEPPQDEADEPVPEYRPGEASVPRQALLDERAKRNDWKGKADKAEAALAEVRRQLEEARKPPQTPPPQNVVAPQQQRQPGFQFADPQTEPALFAMQWAEHMRFENSEQWARNRLGDEAVDKLIEDFAGLANRDPSLWQRIRAQRDPFGWAHRELQRQQILVDVGDDPAAYEAKLRAKWEAERQAAASPSVPAPANTPPPAMPPSLANVRSIAPRAAPVWSGPPSDQQVAAEMRAYRMANRR